ncbi:hypothetical protein [uncultured Mediterranean phage uvMED]|nr:hypothetical protein [uncultured Mediterranean phage uvMED]BAR14836.1 hypothetical protein [uncultured Mediterranean phage uvMED]
MVSKTYIKNILKGHCNKCDRPLHRGIANAIYSNKQEQAVAVCSKCLLENSIRGEYQL